jgi:hypothetical protein
LAQGRQIRDIAHAHQPPSAVSLRSAMLLWPLTGDQDQGGPVCFADLSSTYKTADFKRL